MANHSSHEIILLVIEKVDEVRVTRSDPILSKETEYPCIYTHFSQLELSSNAYCVFSFMSGKVQKEIYYLLLQITLTIIGIGSAPLNIIVVSYIL